jgi:hypothetical protein
MSGSRPWNALEDPPLEDPPSAGASLTWTDAAASWVPDVSQVELFVDDEWWSDPTVGPYVLGEQVEVDTKEDIMLQVQEDSQRHRDPKTFEWINEHETGNEWWARAMAERTAAGTWRPAWVTSLRPLEVTMYKERRFLGSKVNMAIQMPLDMIRKPPYALGEHVEVRDHPHKFWLEGAAAGPEDERERKLSDLFKWKTAWISSLAPLQAYTNVLEPHKAKAWDEMRKLK